MYRSLWKYGSALVILSALVGCGQPASETTAGAPDASQAPITIGGGNTSTEPGQGGPVVMSHGGPVKDHGSFVDSLRAKGFMVEPVGPIEQPFLGTRGEILRVSGGELQQPVEVQSFEYPSADAAAADVGQLGPDGNPKTAMVEWKGAPHFFQKEKLLALYVGDDPAVVKALTDVVGPQVAGR